MSVQGGHILIVDDVQFMRRMLSRIVSGLGYNVVDVEDGASAIQAIRKHPPCLVILDLMMPRISGAEVCGWIRANEATREIPVLICTAHQERKALEKAIRAGASDILFKPITKAALQERLEKHLRATA